MKLRDLIDRAHEITRDVRCGLHIWRKDNKKRRVWMFICAATNKYSYHIYSTRSNIIEKDNISDFLQEVKNRVDLDSENWCISQADIDDLKLNLDFIKRGMEQLEEELNAELHSD